MADTTNAAAEQAGIPQLDFTSFPNQLFWLVVFLVALYAIVSRVAIPRIEGIFEQRRRRIEDDLQEAERLNSEAATLEAEAAALLEQAKKSAGEIAAKTRAEIAESQNAAIADANDHIARKAAESETRINEIRSEAQKTVVEIASAAAAEIAAVSLPGHDLSGDVSSRIRSRVEAP